VDSLIDESARRLRKVPSLLMATSTPSPSPPVPVEEGFSRLVAGLHVNQLAPSVVCVRHRYTILSTGGTAKSIEGAGCPVTKVEDVTNFPEMVCPCSPAPP